MTGDLFLGNVRNATISRPLKDRATWRNINRMTMPSPLGDIEATVQGLRLEQQQSAFTQKLAHF